MSGWHNRLGADGQRLTILSLLANAETLDGQDVPEGHLSLQEALDELFRLAGADGSARVVLYLADPGEDDPQFTSEENVALRDLAARLYQAFGDDGQTPCVLRRLSPDEVRVAASSGSDDPEAGDDAAHGPLAALGRLREAVYRTFGGSVPADQPPTVLSLLVGPKPSDEHPDKHPPESHPSTAATQPRR